MENTKIKSSDDLVAGCFCGEGAPFAMHPLDRKRAALYLQSLLEENKAWKDAEKQITQHLESKAPSLNADDEIERAKKLLKPWL